MVDKKDLFKSKAELVKMELKVVSLPESREKLILLQEINEAKQLITAGDDLYAKTVCSQLSSSVRALKFRAFFSLYNTASSIQLILKGIFLYCIIVSLIGFCAVVVALYNVNPSPWPVVFVKTLGLDPMFRTIMQFGIQPTAYLTGILGAAGAIVSLVKRFEEFENRTGSPWLFFSIGLFSPIVGSLAAVIICKFASAGLNPEFQGMPLMVIAFFAGFSERLLNKVNERL